jgi:hypothetical protein
MPIPRLFNFYNQIKRSEMTELNASRTSGLTPLQENVIAAITGGATMKAAAAAASIHRNTIAYWGKTSAAFRDALSHAQYDKAIFIREEAESHVTEAFAAIHTILTKPDASDSARLNAAKFIIDKACTPPPPKPEIVHSNAQIGFESQNPFAPPEPQKSEIVPGNAQSRPTPTVRSAPKIGRNDPCPCGSHLKFKRCCLGKAPLSAAA